MPYPQYEIARASRRMSPPWHASHSSPATPQSIFGDRHDVDGYEAHPHSTNCEAFLPNLRIATFTGLLYAHKPNPIGHFYLFTQETIEMRNHPGKILLRLKKEVNIGSGNHRGNSTEGRCREEHNRDAPRGSFS
jgi:hypothetical protein